MSIRSKVIAAALALGVVTGVGAAGTLTANAATTTCGTGCVDLFNSALGTTAHPKDVLGVTAAAKPAGQLVFMHSANGRDAGEDFSLSAQGQVSDFVKAGLMASGLGKLYGSLHAVEIVYAPAGKPTELCVGLSAAPAVGTAVSLQQCGVTAKTLWIFDPVTTSASTYYELINGATASNFTDPLVLTAGQAGLPLFTALLAASDPALTHQQWGAIVGALPAS
jgi:hypothetical protein